MKMKIWDRTLTNLVELEPPRPIPMKNWSLYQQQGKIYLSFANKVKHVFHSQTAIKTKVFILLFNNRGTFMSYEELYKFAVGNNYPNKHATAHQRIQRQVNFLRNDLAKLPLKIETDNGARLIINDNYILDEDLDIKNDDE